MARAQPMRMAYNMHTWGRVQLHRVVWDSYVLTPTFVAWETSNEKFTILELVLPITSKSQVTHYPRVTKKKNKHGQQPQPPTKQTRGFYEIKGFISVVSIWGSCLKLLQVALASNFVGWLLPLGSFCLYLSLF